MTHPARAWDRSIVLLVMALSVGACSAPVEPQEPSLAYKLAVIHHGSEPPNEIAMHTFAGLLDSLDAKCAETPTGIAGSRCGGSAPTGGRRHRGIAAGVLREPQRVGP